MDTLRTERKGEVVVARLDRGATNAINLQLVVELAETLEHVRGDSAVRGLVLGSANEKFLSIGFDIPELFGLSKEDFRTFYRAFNRLCVDLYTLPKPTVAAIAGHATAGGCILALCCDYRFIAEGRKFMGLNEIKLGVPVPYPTDCMLRNLIGTRGARDVMESGEFFQPEELFLMGMVDEVLPQEQVLPQAVEKARLLGSFPEGAFPMIKRNRVEAIEAQILERLPEKEEHFVECWYSDESRERLKEAMARF